MKRHDCHIFIERQLPIALQKMLSKEVWITLTELSIFFRDLYSSTITVQHIFELEQNIILTLCKLKNIFSLGFFDSIEYLPVHIAYEARVGEPI